MNVTGTLAAWTAETPRIAAPLALARARQATIDVVACMLAGAREPAAERALAGVRRWGEGDVTLVGRPESLAAPWAALVNGAAAHALDFDDNYSPATTHATAVAMPALLALAEERDRSGADLLDAYIVALEIQARVGQGVNLIHYRKGWHATATTGCIGTAAGCARLLGLDATATRHAISLAVSMAAGVKAQFGTPAKPLHAGLAAKNAVLAATLAEAGMEAAPEPLDAEMGFRALYAGDEAPGFATAMEALGRGPLAIEEFGLAPKLYPCCGSVHRSLDGLLDLRARHGLAPDAVERVETTVPDVNFRNLMYTDPQDGLQGKFSMNYCLAVGLLQGAVRVADFTPEAVARPEVRAWLPRIRMERYPTQSNDPGVKRDPARVRVHLKDGRLLETAVDHARGTIHAPLSEDDYAAKFMDCAAGLLGNDRARTVLAMLAAIDAAPRVREVGAMLRPDPACAAAA